MAVAHVTLLYRSKYLENITISTAITEINFIYLLDLRQKNAVSNLVLHKNLSDVKAIHTVKLQKQRLHSKSPLDLS